MPWCPKSKIIIAQEKTGHKLCPGLKNKLINSNFWEKTLGDPGHGVRVHLYPHMIFYVIVIICNKENLISDTKKCSYQILFVSYIKSSSSSHDEKTEDRAAQSEVRAI